MKYFPLILLLLLSACSRDTGADGERAAAAVAAIALQSERGTSPAPSAPIELDYQMPARAPAGQPLTIELTLNTPIDSGAMIVTVAKQVGVTLLSASVQQIDLASAARPIKLPLSMLPGADARRSLVLSVSVEVGGEQQSRSFRISLPPAVEAGL